MPKYLPVGIQDFEKMILGDFLYVDKTRHIFEMARPLQGFYFLARPRRFGKSLLISTFENLFKGEEALFKGLWIEKSDWEWKPYPVIKIDFSSISSSSPESLEADLKILVRQTAQSFGLNSEGGSLPWRFSRLVVDLAKKSGAPAVVLMDEYDKPIIEHLGKGPDGIELAKKNREILRSFFGVLKSGDVSSALRFVFITGISKFARVSIFSDLNNLNDITMRERYADLLGYTAEELSAFFGSRIQSLSAKLQKETSQVLKKIEHWYDGYRFTESETRVYNPFSVIRMFDAEKFENYWFETATPAFLVHLIKEKQYPVTDVESLKLPREYFSVYDLDRLSLEPLLFQTGYITIRHYDEILFHMGYPNQEVRESFLSYLFNDLTQIVPVNVSGETPASCPKRKEMGSGDDPKSEEDRPHTGYRMMPSSFDNDSLDTALIESFIEKARSTGRINLQDDPFTNLTKLKLIQNGRPTLAAMLLFGDHGYSIHIGRFKGPDTILDDLLIKDPLMTGLDAAMLFIKKHINLSFHFDGSLQRKERWQYPLPALRELLLNAAVHRDYKSASDIVIKIFDHRIIFTSPGKLYEDLTIDDLQGDDYVSAIRNRLLADAFYLMGEIEKYGTGFVRIRKWLKEYPEIRMEMQEKGDFFRVELITMPPDGDAEGPYRPEEWYERLPERLPEKLSDLQQNILNQMQNDPEVTYVQLTRITGKSKEAIRKNIDRLRKRGMVCRIGPARGGHWQINLPGSTFPAGD